MAIKNISDLQISASGDDDNMNKYLVSKDLSTLLAHQRSSISNS